MRKACTAYIPVSSMQASIQSGPSYELQMLSAPERCAFPGYFEQSLLHFLQQLEKCDQPLLVVGARAPFLRACKDAIIA